MAGLNPNAEPFVPMHQRQRNALESGADERSLFMTFSNGAPLTRQEILDHFVGLFGRDVELVYVHEQGSGHSGFGKITFATSYVPRMIMQDQDKVKSMVNRKPLWLKKYIPRSQRNTQTSP